MQQHESDEQPTKQQRKHKWAIQWRCEYTRTWLNVVGELVHPTLEGFIQYQRRGVVTQGLPQLVAYVNEFQPVLQEQVDILNSQIAEA